MMKTARSIKIFQSYAETIPSSKASKCEVATYRKLFATIFSPYHLKKNEKREHANWKNMVEKQKDYENYKKSQNLTHPFSFGCFAAP